MGRHENQRTSQEKKREIKLLFSVTPHTNPSNSVFSANNGYLLLCLPYPFNYFPFLNIVKVQSLKILCDVTPKNG
jgi:hypothetical protein